MKTLNFAALAAIGLLAVGIAVARPTEPDPAGTNPFRVIEVGEMSVARAAHQATPLGSGGILITGGCDDPGCENVLASAEIYDPATRSFRATVEMNTPRDAHVAVGLPDGRALAAGGWTGRGVTAGAELYDPTTGDWTPTSDMTEARMGAVAAPLPDGRVLLAGGATSGSAPLASAEIFDPATMSFSTARPMSAPRTAHAAVVLGDGRVLVTGGRSSRRGPPSRSAEIFDPATGAFEPTGEMTRPRQKHAAALLPDGRIMVVGGSDDHGWDGKHASTEIYDPETGRFSPGPEMRRARFKLRDAVVALPLSPSGAVLVAGGAVRPELYHGGTGNFLRVQGASTGPRMFATATPLPTGEVLILGGYDDRVRPSASAALFFVER